MTTHRDIVHGYIDGVMSGEIVAGRLVKLAVRRHLEDLERAGDRGFYFDEKIAEETCSFFPSCLKHYIGRWAGDPFHLTPFQAFVTWVLFGWRRYEDKYRRFRKAYVTQARKGGKTTWAGGIAILGAAADNPIEEAADVYIVATKEEQAKELMFRDTKLMIENSPSLLRVAEILTRNIAFPHSNSAIRFLGSNSKTNAGWRPHMALLDEVCDWQERHRDLWGALTTAMGNRDQPLRLVTCTAGDDESEIWKEEDAYAVAVVEAVLTGNIIDDEYFAFIARLDDARPCDSCDGTGCGKCDKGTIPADDPFDESVWEKANPNLHYIATLPGYLRGQAVEAKNKPSAKQDYLRYHMNLLVTRSFKAIDMENWPKGNVPLSDWSQAVVYGAYDLGWSSDLASISLVARFFEGQDEDHNDRYRYECRSWSFLCEECPYDLNTEPWASFIADGCLTITPGTTTDIPGAFKQKILQVTEEFNVVQWAHDTSGALHLAVELAEDGIECFKFPQSPLMYTPAFKLYLDLVVEGLFVHNGDRLLEWTARNLVAKKNHMEQIMPDKAKSKSKIDPQTATIMAIGGAMTCKHEGFWKASDGVWS